MGQVIAASVGATVALGIVLVLAGAQKTVPSTKLSPDLWKRFTNLWESWTPIRRAWVVGSFAAGFLLAVATGWLVAIVVIPAASLGIPALLAAPPQREVDVLAALDRWVRLLSPSIATGKSIRDAIIATRAQAPTLLAPSVSRLVARLDEGWSTREALLAMAEEVESADSDAVLAALAIASSRGGVGARATLAALSETTQDRLRVLREIASERSKPRAVVRQVTLITLGILGGSVLLGGSFFEPYSTPLGQVLVLCLAGAYVGSLVMLRRRTTPEPTARYLKAGT